MKKNPLFGGEDKDEVILKPPPVDRLYAIYGRNAGSFWCPGPISLMVFYHTMQVST